MRKNRETQEVAKQDYSRFLSKQINSKEAVNKIFEQEKQRFGQQMQYKQMLVEK